MPSSPQAALLVLPGWDDDGKDQFDDLVERLAPTGWLLRRADLPDAKWPAERRDAVNRKENLRQTRADFDALAAEAGPVPIAMLGFSYGAYMAALLLKERHADWLILRAPAIYPDHSWLTPKSELDKQEIARYRGHEHTPAGNRALAACTGFEGDVLLVEGGSDEVIPRFVVDSYQDAFTAAHSVARFGIPGADHDLSSDAWQLAYHEKVQQWLNERLEERYGGMLEAPSAHG